MASVVTSKLLKKYSPMLPVFIADAKFDHNQCFGRPMIFDPNISSFDLREKGTPYALSGNQTSSQIRTDIPFPMIHNVRICAPSEGKICNLHR